MSPSYLSPGVYVEEVDKGTKPIEAVGTAVAAFIGYTERASAEKDGAVVSLLGKPTLVTNWAQYVKSFGGFVEGAYLPDSVYGYFNNHYQGHSPASCQQFKRLLGLPVVEAEELIVQPSLF